MSYRWLTPVDPPVDRLTVTVTIPNTEQQISMLFGVFLDLTNPENHEQVYGTVTAEQAASHWQQTLDEFEAQL